MTERDRTEAMMGAISDGPFSDGLDAIFGKLELDVDAAFAPLLNPTPRTEAQQAESAWGWYLMTLKHHWIFIPPEGMSPESRAHHDELRSAFLAGRASVKP